MIHGKKRVAYHIIQARNIIHSPVDEEKGANCGVLRSIYFQASNIPSVADFMTGVCKMNIMIWMGLSRHLNSYIPHGFLFSLEPIPKSLVAEEKHIFEARVYVYKCTHFSDIDLDSIGRCGSVVYVVIGHQYRKTQTVKKRVHTEWDQTLVFRHVVLYGARDFMAANLPKVTIEIYDRHECVMRSSFVIFRLYWNISEQVGSCGQDRHEAAAQDDRRAASSSQAVVVPDLQRDQRQCAALDSC
jgi:hypothetical protein